MFEITKDRNLLSIRLYETQRTPYTLDINTGVFLGQQGKPIKTIPKYWNTNIQIAKESVSATNHPLGNLIYALYYITQYDDNIITAFSRVDGYRDFLGLCDRLQSIGYSIDYHDMRDIYCNPISNADFRAFAKYHKSNPTVTLREWRENNALEKWCTENGLSIDDHFTVPMAKLIKDYDIEDTNEIKWYAYFLSRGLYDFGELTINTSGVMHWIDTYLDTVKKLGQEPQKGDFIRLYNDALRTYRLRKAEIDNRAIAEYQNSKLHALQFEDEQFIVRVPMTSEEIIAEGEAQNNCVGRLYLPKVVKNTRHIVFVRQKSNPDKSYITCEIYNDGSIGQYLLKHNHSVEWSSDAYKFKLKYQEFLNNHWNEA